jgi:DNA-binding transcriptional ArsR family regulator
VTSRKRQETWLKPVLATLEGGKGLLTEDEGAALNAAMDALFRSHPKAAALFKSDWREAAAAKTRSRTAWEFLQVDAAVERQVSTWIMESAPRKKETRKIWDMIRCHIDKRDGRIMKTREEIAEELGIAPRNVSTAMSAMAKVGIISRIEMGRTVLYRLSPHVGTKLPRVAGSDARKAMARPKLVAEDGQRIEDQRQLEIEDAVVKAARRGQLLWDLPPEQQR